jgi:hypothetical protein
MKKIFLGCCLLLFTCVHSQNVGIGTTTPNTYGKLHVHNDATFDASISLTNGLTTDVNLRGARLRMLNNDLNIINYEATGKLNLATGFNVRMTIDDAGNVGIGTTTPTYRLHVLNSTASAFSAIQTTAAGERAELQLLGDNNPFNTLFIQKYAPGAGGTFGGISKDNLSVISTGGNAGTLVIGTGETVRMQANGQVAIGTNTPAPTGKLHIHDAIANQDVSLVMTNSLTGPNNLRGLRLRLLNSDITLSNYEPTGSINFSTAFNTRMTIDNAGNVGIGTSTPVSPLQVVTNASVDAVTVLSGGSNVAGITSINNSGANTTGVYAGSSANGNALNYIVGVRGITGNGGTTLVPSYNVGVIGESLNQTRGVGVYASSNSPSAAKTEGAVVAINWFSGNDAYGIIGNTNGTTGAGVLGVTVNSGTIGVQGYGTATGATALKGEILAGLSGTALELANGSIKVSGGSRPVFQITTSVGNISGNTVNIPLGTQANTPTDMLVVTPVFTGTYLNKPIGVWWNGSNWTIFTQDLSAMPVGVVFNVLVVKQ